MDLAYLRQLIGFHYWARDRVLAAAATLSREQYKQTLGSSFPSIRATLNHTYMAEWAWFSRWQGTSPTAFPPQELFPDLETLQTAWAAQESQLRAYITSLGDDDAGRWYDYKLISGIPGRSKFWEMVLHLVNHGTYHRGQVTTMLRQLGARAPESTDMITFFRAVGNALR